MKIDEKYIGTIIASLEFSIRYCREYHQKEVAKYMEHNREYPYDYERKSIAPIQEALNSIKTKRDESKN